MDARGGQDPGRPHPELRPQQLARAAQASRAAAVRQELPAPVDQLPAPRHQARQLQQGGRGRHHQPPRAARQQVVRDRRQAARTDGQRDQERLAHAPQEAAGAHQQAGAARGEGSWRRQEAQAQARGRQEGDGPGHHRAGVARTVGGLVVGDRVVVHDGAGAGAGQHGELARVPQGGELHLLLGRRGVPVRRHLLVGDAVHAARELRRPHGALRRAGRVVGWRRRRHGLLAQSVHGVWRRAPGTAADLERAREDFSVPWLIDSSFFSLPLHCTSCIGGRGQ